MESINDRQLSVVRERLGRLYAFLREFAQARYPVARDVDQLDFRLWLDDIPDHSSIERGWLDDSADFALRVTRPELTECPEPPDALRDWLQSGWRDPKRTLEIAPERTSPSVVPEEPPEVERFDDDPARIRALQAWTSRRDKWAGAERPARDAMHVFERLYRLHGRLDRERELLDLYAGDAMLHWSTRSVRIHHPLILQAMQLDFEADIRRFTVAFGDRPTELNTVLLRSIDEVDGRVLAEIDKDFDQDQYGPFSGREIDGFLHALAARLHVHGVYRDTASAPRKAPTIIRRPLFMLRRRTQGFIAALDAIQSDLPGREDVPVALRSIAGVHEILTPDSPDSNPSPGLPRLANEDPDLLFTKPANDEQARIARQLEHRNATMVQGPPGTGKTHTIANLIGHLLAQGKRVLVTSHTAKALDRVHEVVVKELQPLAVSAVGADAEERAQLERSVRTITNRLASGDARQLRREAQSFRTRRQRLLNDLGERRRELRDTLYSEYRDIVVASDGVRPSNAAREVFSGCGQDDWIPGPIEEESLTLSPPEVLDLYATNHTVDPRLERELACPLPPLNGEGSPPKPSDFEDLVRTEQEIASARPPVVGELWYSYPDQTMGEAIACLARDAEKTADQIRSLEDWELRLIQAGLRGGGARKVWEELLEAIEQVRTQVDQAEPLIKRYGPQIPNALPTDQTAHTLRDIHAHVAQGGSLGRFVLLRRRAWADLLKTCSADVGSTHDPKVIESLDALAQIRLARERLRSHWQRTAGSAGMPSASRLGPEPEDDCEQFAPAIRKWLDWTIAAWEPLVVRAHAIGLNVDALLEASGPHLGAYGEPKRIMDVAGTRLPAQVGAMARRLRLDRIRQQLRRIDSGLAQFDRGTYANDTTPVLRTAVRERSPHAYAQAHERLKRLRFQLPHYRTRSTLLERLRKSAPAWAESVRRRKDGHAARQPPGDTKAAWRWRVLNDELERRAKVDISEIQVEIERLEKELQQATGSLVERLAWAAQIEGTSPGQQQNLKSWMLAMKKVGRGTGKRAPRLLAEARKYMDHGREAVPVWIMPLSRVVETFDFTTTRFDVLIVDEASQSDVLALTALYLADQVVIVGDDEQVSPAAVGQDTDKIQRLIDQHLRDLPNGELYDGRASIYDLGFAAFGGSVQLREHFRCVPDIIEFSNQLSYDGGIKPLRDVSDAKRRPAVVEERVDGERNDFNQNEAEAEFIVSAILAACEFEEYQDATFGVISMLRQGNAQGRLIESLLHRWMDPMEFERRRVLVGGPPEFQGDERDVVFLSLVDSPNQPRGPHRLRRDDQTKKRYNVAASRAKDQMWLVHSLDPEVDLQSEDLRARLIRHAMSPKGISQQIAHKQEHAEWPFEKRVVAHLIRAGYRVESQHPVGALRIDIVVHGDNQRRVAIECDGDRYHTLDNLADDLSRQALLERLGWRFVRIRGSEYFRNPRSAIARVRGRLTELGVEPTGEAPTEPPESSDLLDRVRAHAAEIRQSWREADDSSEPASAPSDGAAEMTMADGSSAVRSAEHTAPVPVPPTPSLFDHFDDVAQRPVAVHDDDAVANGPSSGRTLDPATPMKNDRSTRVSQTRESPSATDDTVGALPFRDPLERSESSHAPDRETGASAVSANAASTHRSQEPRQTHAARTQHRRDTRNAEPARKPSRLVGRARLSQEDQAQQLQERQAQLTREHSALKAAYDDLYALQTPELGSVNIAKLILEPRRAFDRAMQYAGNHPSPYMSKRAARQAIKAALANIEAELESR